MAIAITAPLSKISLLAIRAYQAVSTWGLAIAAAAAVVQGPDALEQTRLFGMHFSEWFSSSLLSLIFEGYRFNSLLFRWHCLCIELSAISIALLALVYRLDFL